MPTQYLSNFRRFLLLLDILDFLNRQRYYHKFYRFVICYNDVWSSLRSNLPLPLRQKCKNHIVHTVYWLVEMKKGECILHTDKKENQIFVIYKEIQSGAVAESYMRKGFLIYEEMRKYFPIYEEAFCHIWLCNCSTLNFLIYEENLIFFFMPTQLERTLELCTWC